MSIPLSQLTEDDVWGFLDLYSIVADMVRDWDCALDHLRILQTQCLARVSSSSLLHMSAAVLSLARGLKTYIAIP